MTECKEDTTLSDRMDFIGQRADVISVRRATHADPPEEQVGDPPKVVEQSTVSCDECESVGYIDNIGQIICSGCGMVLSGARENKQYPDQDKSRGFEIENDIRNRTQGPSYDG